MAVSDQVRTPRSLIPEGVLRRDCPTRVVLDHVTSRWGVLVLVALAGGTLRWGELRRTVQGVSEKMLAQTLQTLDRDGFVHREALPVIPPHVEYSLTDLGRSLVERLLPLMEWLNEHSAAIVAAAAGDGAAVPAAAGRSSPGPQAPGATGS